MNQRQRKRCTRPTGPRLSHHIVHDWRQLSDTEDQWWQLLARSSTNEPTLSPLWLGAWWRVFGERDRRALRCVLVREADALVGIAPLLRRTHWYRPGIPLRRLELVGSGEDERDEICSEYIGVIAAAGAEQGVADELVGALCAGHLGGWDELLLPWMDADAPTVGALERALTGAGLAFDAKVTAGAPYIPLPAHWDRYLEALPSRSRYLLRRTERDLAAWAAGALRWHRVESPAELAEGVSVLRRLHEQRWRGRGAFGAARFEAFHARVLPELLARGALDLSWLTVRGEPIGALYNIVWNDKVYYYQSGRHTDLPAAIRPGIALHAAAIRRAITAGRREYDFLAGSQRFKQQLALAERPLVQLRVARGGARELALDLVRRGVRAVRARAGR